MHRLNSHRKPPKRVCFPAVRADMLYDETLGASLSRLETFGVKQIKRLTGVIEREDDGYVALCPELDIASQGDTVDEARRNLIEAVELFFEDASPTEIQQRMHNEVYVTPIEVRIG